MDVGWYSPADLNISWRLMEAAFVVVLEHGTYSLNIPSIYMDLSFSSFLLFIPHYFFVLLHSIELQ